MAAFYSVIIAFSKDRKNILLGKRREDSKWTSIAGGGNEGEQPKECAIREAFEEANLKLKEEDLKPLTSITAKNGKPIFLFTTCLDSKQDIHTKNDPDREVPSWKWFPLNSMPQIDSNKLETINMAKMRMMDLVKSIVSNDMFSGTDIITQNYSQDDLAARNSGFFEYLTESLSECVMNQPMDVTLEEGSIMTVHKIAEGLYSGSVKTPQGERLMNFSELTIPSLVQALKAKQIISDLPEEFEEEEVSEIIEENSNANPLNSVMEALKNVQINGDLHININKSVKEFTELLKKGRKAEIGEVRHWSNGPHVKHADGWVAVGGPHHGKLMGKYKEEATHTDVANAHKDKEESESKDSIAAKKKAHAEKIEKLKAEHAKMLQDLQTAHEKEIAESEGDKSEEKGKGPETKPKDSKEGKGSNKEETESGEGESPEAGGEANNTGDGSSEGSEGVSGEDEEAESPRDEVEGLLESQTEYENARASKVTNLGEDLLDSARHKAAWRTAAEAEATGQAKKVVMRAKMLKEDPMDFEAKASDASEKALKAAYMYQAMQSFPTGPNYKLLENSGYKRMRERYEKTWINATQEEKDDFKNRGVKPREIDIIDEAGLRKEYIETFKKVKDKAVELAENPEINAEESIKQLQSFVGQELADLRKDSQGGTAGYGGGGKLSPMAEQLVSFYNKALLHGASSVRSKVATLLKEKDALEFKENPKGAHWVRLHSVSADKADEIYNQVKAGMEKGKNLKTSLDVKSTGPERKKYKINGPAQFYVIDRAERKGPKTDLSNMKDAQKSLTPDGEFEMRGVQYGNSVTDEERVHHTTRVAESLQDLTDILGIPSEMASFNGRLGLAIGARGHGTAMAHYEPDMKVINLTRKNGVGTLAHEWGHFMDDILGSVNRAGGFLSDVSPIEREDSSKSIQAMAAFKNSEAWNEFKTNVRDSVRESVLNGSMAQTKAKYWNSDIECFARAFEAHVQHKLETAGRENTYLSAAPKDTKLWPNEDMRAKLAPEFDKLMAQIKASGDLKKALLLMAFEALIKGKAFPVGTVREYTNGQKMKKLANGKWETISSKSDPKPEEKPEPPTDPEPTKSPSPKEESKPEPEAPKTQELTDEQKHRRERNPSHFKRTQAAIDEIGDMTEKEFMKYSKEKMAKQLKAEHPDASDQTIKDAIISAKVAGHARKYHRDAIQYAERYGIEVPDAVKADSQAQIAKKEQQKEEAASGILPEGVSEELNSKTNLIRSVDFSKTSKKNAQILHKHLNDMNIIVNEMGIKFKSPMKFTCERLGNGTKEVRGTYARGTNTITLKDKSAANKTVMHEIGHGLDYAMGEGKFRSEELNKMGNEQLRKDFEELSNLVTNSKYYIEAHKDDISYLNRPTEIFARAFEVYSLKQAEDLIAKGKVSKDFVDTFVPDIFKQKDPYLEELRKEVNEKVAALNATKKRDAYTELHKEYIELSRKLSSRVEELGGAYVHVAPEQQVEYKAKISTLMKRILATDTIKKALDLIGLISTLKRYGK